MSPAGQESPRLGEAGRPTGAVEEVGGGPGPRHSGKEVGESILHWRAGVGLLGWRQGSCQRAPQRWSSCPSQASLWEGSPRAGHVGLHKLPGPPSQSLLHHGEQDGRSRDGGRGARALSPDPRALLPAWPEQRPRASSQQVRMGHSLCAHEAVPTEP